MHKRIGFCSPNSSFSPEELEQLKHCIEELNDLLRTLGNPKDPNNLTALTHRFRMLHGLLIRVKIRGIDQNKEIIGLLKEAGKDFISVDTVGRIFYIPFERICSIERNVSDKHSEKHAIHQELINADKCVKRDLVLRFGEVVSRDPKLINLFFGIRLFLLLNSFLGHEVSVKTEDQEEEIAGNLIEANKEHVLVQTGENGAKKTDWKNICFLSISNAS